MNFFSFLFSFLYIYIGAILVTPSIPLEFHKDIHQAEIVIDQTNLAKDFSNGDADYEDWLEKGKFVPDTVSFNQPFIHKNNVFRLDGYVDEKGFEDWAQRSAARPDLALTGIYKKGKRKYNKVIYLLFKKRNMNMN